MPQSASSQSSQIDLRPQKIVNWINELPRGSVGKTSELIYKALLQINRQEMKPADRFRVLESLRESVHYVTMNLSRHLNGTSYPLPEKIVQIASACHSIHNNMTLAYYRIFDELKDQNILFVDKGMLNTAIHRSLKYLQQSLLLVYKTFSAFHHDYWEQLHKLYQYAEINRLASNSVIDNVLLKKRKTSIENEYIHALLLYLSEPYHLRPGEIEEVNLHLERWHHLVSLKTVDDASIFATDDRLIVVELDQDQPPAVIRKSPLINDIKNCRIVEISPLLEYLSKELEQRIEQPASAKSKIGVAPIRLNLLRRLVESWGQTKKRRFPRNNIVEKVNITIGLHQTHMQLLYEQHLKHLDRDTFSGFFTKPEFEMADVTDVNSKDSDVWETVYAWTKTDVTDVDQSASSQKQITDYRVKQENWTLLNESASGFCVMSVEKQSNKIQVGEIISLQRQNSAQRIIGLVRWIKAYGPSGIQIGGMMMAPSALSVRVSHADTDTQDKIVDRCLLLPLIPMLNQPESLLTFSRQYKNGDELELTDPDKKTSSIKLNTIIADNGIVSQFLFTYVVKTQYDKDTDAEEIDELSNHFNDIWQSI
mgnify:CR=1 FL=1